CHFNSTNDEFDLVSKKLEHRVTSTNPPGHETTFRLDHFVYILVYLLSLAFDLDGLLDHPLRSFDLLVVAFPRLVDLDLDLRSVVEIIEEINHRLPGERDGHRVRADSFDDRSPFRVHGLDLQDQTC